MTTTWNPSDKSAGTTLSNGNLTASMAAQNDGARSTTSQTSGKIAFAVTGDWLTGDLCAGISKLGASYSGGDANGWSAGYSTFFGGWVLNTNNLSAGSVLDTTSPPPTSTSTVTYYLDDNSGILYVSCDGNNLFSGNVSGGTGGASVGTGTWFATIGDINGASGSTSGTANFSPTGLPSGWSGWDASGATNYTLTAAQGSFSLTGFAVTKPTGLVSKITYGGEGDGVTTATIPAHNVGDLLLAWAFRDGSTTLPTLPAGWTSILTKTGTTCCARLAYKIATSTSDSSGTWTSATELIIQVYPGVDRIGASASNSGSSTSVNYPALTFQSDKAWVAGFSGHRSTNTSLETPPTGMTNRADHTDATAEAAGHDTNGTVTSWASTNVAVGGTSSGWVSATVELIPTYSGVPAAGYTLTSGSGSFALTARLRASSSDVFSGGSRIIRSYRRKRRTSARLYAIGLASFVHADRRGNSTRNCTQSCCGSGIIRFNRRSSQSDLWPRPDSRTGQFQPDRGECRSCLRSGAWCGTGGIHSCRPNCNASLRARRAHSLIWEFRSNRRGRQSSGWTFYLCGSRRVHAHRRIRWFGLWARAVFEPRQALHTQVRM